MKEAIVAQAQNYSLYDIRRPDFLGKTGPVPFRVSPEPLFLSREQSAEVRVIGKEITDFIDAACELYSTRDEVRAMLSAGKPEIFCQQEDQRYLFVRPDIIITPAGFSICEIESSPFGLALADILNKSYVSEGFDTMVGGDDLSDSIRRGTPANGTILYSDKTANYKGQLSYLADIVFSDGKDRVWQAGHVREHSPDNSLPLYRGFYLVEYLTDPFVKKLLEIKNGKNETILPSLTPYLEEKAILALLWDRRYEKFLSEQLGVGAFNHLRKIVPPTWVVGYERYFAPGLPSGVSSSVDLASLSRSKRAFVLKPSGFSANSSWAKGVSFLHEKSRQRAQELLQTAKLDGTGLYVVQEFRKGLNIQMQYEGEDAELMLMAARVRLTPYFATTGGKRGELIAVKATACENTNYVHASTASINTAVAEE